jgi:peptidoglycan/xylan/chitin deacetylase (PgdA/CDA1 family)
LASSDRWLTKLWLEFAYFSGRAWWGEKEHGGAGAILRFQCVRPRRRGSFQPLKAGEITPRFLDHAICALKRWKYDIVGMDEACRRAVVMQEPRRFVCLSFDGGCKDVITFAYPVLARHRVPFAVYVPTAFPDGVGEAWWLALEAIIAKENRLSLVVEGHERHFTIATTAAKYELYDFLSGWMRSLPQAELSVAINDLCKRHSVDLARLTREASMDWADLATLAADPNVTFGSATVDYAVLSNLKDASALREMTMGRAVLEAALRREVRHFAFPFGDRTAWRRAHVVMAQQAGFASAVSSISGVVEAEGRTSLHVLPRIDWDGRERSLRVMRVLLSGATFAPVQPTRNRPTI